MRQRDLKFTFVVGEGNLAFDVVEFELEEALCEPFRHRIVAPGVVGSIPIVHPIFRSARPEAWRFHFQAVSRGRGGIGRHTGFRFQRRKA